MSRDPGAWNRRPRQSFQNRDGPYCRIVPKVEQDGTVGYMPLSQLEVVDRTIGSCRSAREYD
jgi:hypothetical protein